MLILGAMLIHMHGVKCKGEVQMYVPCKILRFLCTTPSVLFYISFSSMHPCKIRLFPFQPRKARLLTFLRRFIVNLLVAIKGARTATYVYIRVAFALGNFQLVNYLRDAQSCHLTVDAEYFVLMKERRKTIGL